MIIIDSLTQDRSEYLKDEVRTVKGKVITKTVLRPPNAEDRLAFTLDGVFTPEECQKWIDLTENKGYEDALVNVGGGDQVLMKDVRNNKRCIIDSPEMAAEIMEIIQEFLPQTWNRKELSTLNERLRFLRYDPGQKFKGHFDGMYIRPDNSEASYITVQLYLNEGFKGGSTTFLHRQERVECVPKTGRVLIFEHKIFHEGSALLEGRKYACRTDVMYKN